MNQEKKKPKKPPVLRAESFTQACPMPRSSEVKKLEGNLPADSQNSQISSGYMYIKEAPLTQTDKREKANKHQKGPKKTPHLQDSTK